ncbi:hypothetical protein [Spirosoma telluris]|uniref:hypothetical protein n=1 Tax=Spirosoma telluris TaxID=2183553 RepID=UPI002FC3BCAD
MPIYRSIIIDDEVLARGVIRTFLQTDPSIKLVDEAGNGPKPLSKFYSTVLILFFWIFRCPSLMASKY